MCKISLIAVGDTYKTGPLVHDQADEAYCEEVRNYNDDDQMEGMRKQAASSPQGSDDRPAGNDPRPHREQDETEGDDLTGEIGHFRVRAVEQTFQGHPTKGIQQRKYYGEQEKDNTNHQGRLGVCEESVSLRRNGIRRFMVTCPPASHDWQQDEADGEQVEPQDEKQHEGEIFMEISPVDDFHDHERKDEEQTDECR